MKIQLLTALTLGLLGSSALAGGGMPMDEKAAHASVLMGISGPDMVKILKELDYTATLTMDESDEPEISFSAKDRDITIYFYDCNEQKVCDSVDFSLNMELPKDLTLERVNEWNYQKRWIKISTDEEKLYFDTSYYVSKGVTSAQVSDAVDTYVGFIDNLNDFLGGAEEF